jgi:hypothetical protein
MSLKYIANCCLSIAVLAVPTAQAATRPIGQRTAPFAQGASAQCSYGYRLDPSGFCVDSMNYSRTCPPTYFPLSFPNGNAYRCVPTEWLASSGWLGDFFRPWDNGLPR